MIVLQSIYLSLRDDLYKFASSIAYDEHEAQDLIQQALEKAMHLDDLSSWPKYKQKAWFYRVMKNQLIDQRRKFKREMNIDQNEEVILPTFMKTSIEMVELLSQLSAIESDIIFKKYWIGLKSDEIAIKLGLSASTVRYHLAKAMKKLRKILEEEQ
ncbi:MULTISPECIES: RNA polymerase sigma factor [Cytobacillus]|uniref:RNA polymerase sigma factor n=1 Tax=Cytobacillus TaxID=2675230 RepID=UPI001CD7248D|nr:RNA polymerase sigma factor [Cytobacillus kochii]MCA1025066.1 RNA polymerase sigma factor [Cytobacillus kochii]MCM3324110.1 RNA polymerase sigma factor [Cytobacillus kochii]MCM3346486.1 RNA polymerase sigma factor [Cytobacillus kochii]